MNTVQNPARPEPVREAGSPTAVRQGVKLGVMRWVLGISLGLAILAMLIIFVLS